MFCWFHWTDVTCLALSWSMDSLFLRLRNCPWWSLTRLQKPHHRTRPNSCRSSCFQVPKCATDLFLPLEIKWTWTSWVDLRKDKNRTWMFCTKCRSCVWPQCWWSHQLLGTRWVSLDHWTLLKLLCTSSAESLSLFFVSVLSSEALSTPQAWAKCSSFQGSMQQIEHLQPLQSSVHTEVCLSK